ncbi:uncharacterized protein V6R79_024118 [Siganus canaliculatus]
MATMSQTWPIFIVLAVLAARLCAGEKSCAIQSSAGPVVQRGSSFEVYCTFKRTCKKRMISYPKPTPQSQEYNTTTIYFKVANITEDRTYSCRCFSPLLDPCGLDIFAGYPPDQPKNLSCIYQVTSDQIGVVTCTWNRGKETCLRDQKNGSLLWVKAVTGNLTLEPKTYKNLSKGTHPPRASITVPSSVQLISVWVQVQNQLGSAKSITTNYRLRDIAMPSAPELVQPDCSSRECILRVKQSVQTQHVEIQYRAETEQTWTSHLNTDVQMASEEGHSICFLEPYRLYHFRARSKFSTGLWSEWSANVSSWTQEEAPAIAMDVWYSETSADFTSLRVYWKEVNVSVARGKITAYVARVYSQTSGLVCSVNISTDARTYVVQFCADCTVTMWACNSKGMSPPARIATRHIQAKSLDGLHVTANNLSASISWTKAETAPPNAAVVLEWYPKGHKLEELNWLKLGSEDHHITITGIKPFECYEGAVYVVYNETSVGKTSFAGLATLESAPAAGPLPQETVEGNKVKVAWAELHSDTRKGCLTNYTIYLENGSGLQNSYYVPASERWFIIKDLPPSVYSLWMTASTAKGEGPAGQRIKFFIQQEPQLSLLLVCLFLFLITSCVLCLCQSSAVKQRFWVFFQCLMLHDVPDPANSKWAKECTQEQGKINLHMQPGGPSATEEEEEPILVDVEELPKPTGTSHKTPDVSSRLLPQISQGPLTEPATLLYPLTTYIKSFSHDSDSSDHTQTSLDTNTTAGYISSQGNMEEYQEEEEEEEEFVEMLDFFPSHNIFMDSLQIGGKLTLDAVKIDCNDLFHNSFS